uniref:Ribonuclease A-domain domain-containing protein n=1 Tax=Oreochromis aureus TaxID=47969 RepID=A0AAZ1X2S5_OREAU
MHGAPSTPTETMRIMFAGLLLVLLFDTGLSKLANLQPKQQQNETPYEKFRRQHVDAKMSAEKCDTEIKNRQIYDVNSRCKFTNTFILSDDKEVKAICNGQGRYDRKSRMTKSVSKFSVVICKLKKKRTREPKCQYEGKRLTNRIILVKCKGKLPVH